MDTAIECVWLCRLDENNYYAHVLNTFYFWIFNFILKWNWWRFRKPILFDGSPFNPCNSLIRFSTKKTLLPFLNIFTNWRCILYICTMNYIFIQVYKCGSIVNPRTNWIYIMNHVPSQIYKCCLAMLLRQLNYSTICAWFFYNWT